MDEQTVNAEPTEVLEQAEPITQEPEEQAPVSEPTEQQAAPEVQQDDSADWLKSKGLDPENFDQAKAVEMWRNAEKLGHSKSQQAADLQKQMAQPSPMVDNELYGEVQALKNHIAVEDFRSSHELAPEVESEMARLINDGSDVFKAQVREGLISLENLEAMALYGLGRLDTSQIKAEARKETLQEVASKQRATFPRANATNAAEFSKPEKADPFLTGIKSGM